MTTERAVDDGMPQFGYGDRIRLIRQEVGLTVAEFAAQIDVTDSTLSRHEHLHDVPTRNPKLLANSIELRYGSRWPGGLSHWLMKGHALGEHPTTCPECAASNGAGGDVTRQDDDGCNITWLVAA